MLFPAASPILDPLNGPTGTLAGSWISPGPFGDATGLTIPVAGGGATAASLGAFSSSSWRQQLAVFASAFVTVAVLPANGVGAQVNIGATSDVHPGTDTINVSYQPDAGPLLALTAGSNVSSSAVTLNSGDQIAVQMSNLAAVAYLRRATSPAWTSLFSVGATVLGNGLGWFLFMETNDTTVRLKNFGGETLAGTDPTFNSSNVHGRGAC